MSVSRHGNRSLWLFETQRGLKQGIYYQRLGKAKEVKGLLEVTQKSGITRRRATLPKILLAVLGLGSVCWK
jgi:hypothetical protein